MTKTYTAPFAQSPKTADVAVTAAIASLTSDAPTGVSLLLTAGADGAIVTRLWALPRGTTTATSICLFISRDGGTTIRLKDSETMAAYTAATTTNKPETPFANYSEDRPLRLGANDKLYVGCEVAQPVGVVFNAEYTDY